MLSMVLNHMCPLKHRYILNTFFVKNQIFDILGFAEYNVLKTSKLCYCSVKATIDNT